MCRFFSFVGDGYGNFLYADWETREKLIKEKSYDIPDSHTFVLTKNKIPPKMQDRWSTYEYNPLSKEFFVDNGVEGHDHESAKNWVENLDFKKIVPDLIIKSITNPLRGNKKKITKKEIELLKEWASVMGYIYRDFVWDVTLESVRASDSGSVWNFISASVGYSVWDSVRDAVWHSVWVPIGDSVFDSIGESAKSPLWGCIDAALGAYISSFFNLPCQYDFSPLIKLWEAGFMPSFDGTYWRLHSGAKGRWEIIEIEEESLE